MDRTINLQNSMIHSSKKSNETLKFTESFLCDEIHDNLRTLALIHPFSDEFKEFFEKGMFIKPNAKAFPHVMKYLFMICDPVDFKKKFCWPIYNKAAEATFRNSTLDLLNKLNAKYELGFGEVKNKILIFPGGMEFMRVIYLLTRLAMQIILKRNGIHDPEQQRPISMTHAKERLEALEDLYNFVTDFKKKVEILSKQLKPKTEILYKLLQLLMANTNIKVENILEDGFIESWSDVQNDIVDRGILPDVARLTKFQQNCQRIEEKVSAIFKQHTITFNKHALASFSSEIQQQYPQNYHQLTRVIENGHINYDHLLHAFSLALPTMLQLIESYKPPSVDAMAYEAKRLQQISLKTDEVLQRTLQFSASFEMEKNKIESQSVHVAPQFENIQSMILSTPTISHDAIRRAEGAVMQTKRISLLDDAYQLRPATSMLSVTSKPLNSILEESLRGGQKQFLSPTRLFSRDPKAKLDPMAMLQSITKKEKKDKHMSSSNFKPKLLNLGHRFGIGNHPCDNSKVNDTTLSVPDFSSTLLNQSNDIKDILFNVTEQINTSLAKSGNKNANDRKMHSLLAGDTLNNSERDINCSPSGRIEALVKTKLNLSDIKPIQLLASNEQNNSNVSGTGLSISGIAPIESKLSNASDVAAMRMSNDRSNIENNQNAPNRHLFNLNNMIDENDESLLNISDRILNNLDDSILT